jgi:hypothetical protein
MSEEILGPIDCLAVEFPGAEVTGEGFRLLMDLVEAGTIRVLDLEFIAKAADGSISKVSLGDIEHAGDVDVTLWGGASTGLLDETDIAQAGASIEPGSLAGILVYENAWAVPLMTALDRSAARLVGWERIAPRDLEAALDQSEPA